VKKTLVKKCFIDQYIQNKNDILGSEHCFDASCLVNISNLLFSFSQFAKLKKKKLSRKSSVLAVFSAQLFFFQKKMLKALFFLVCLLDY